MADLVIAALLRASRKLLAVPWRENGPEKEALMAPLPPPIFPRNTAAEHETCIVGDNLLKALISKKGFDWINDRKESLLPPKMGWTAYDPEAEITLKLPLNKNETSTLSIGYLTSYEQMGSFKITCSSGCSCEPKICEGHEASRKVSQVSVATVSISSTPGGQDCNINILSLSQTKGGKHKVKITALILGNVDSSLFHELDGQNL